MKKKTIFSIVLMGLLSIASLNLAAQNGNGRGRMNMNYGDRQAMTCLDLDEEQQAQADLLRTDMQKAMIPLRADLNIKKAELKQLMVQTKPDEKAIMSQVETIGGLKTEIQKLKVAHKLQMRSILNEDQKAQFDMQQLRNGKKNKRMGKGQNRNNQSGMRGMQNNPF